MVAFPIGCLYGADEAVEMMGENKNYVNMHTSAELSKENEDTQISNWETYNLLNINNMYGNGTGSSSTIRRLEFTSWSIPRSETQQPDRHKTFHHNSIFSWFLVRSDSLIIVIAYLLYSVKDWYFHTVPDSPNKLKNVITLWTKFFNK